MKGKEWRLILMLIPLVLLASFVVGCMGRIDFILNKAIKTAILLLLFVDLIAMCIAGYIYFGFFLQKKIKDTEEEKVTSEPIYSDNKKKKEQEQKN